MVIFCALFRLLFGKRQNFFGLFFKFFFYFGIFNGGSVYRHIEVSSPHCRLYAAFGGAQIAGGVGVGIANEGTAKGKGLSCKGEGLKGHFGGLYSSLLNLGRAELFLLVGLLGQLEGGRNKTVGVGVCLLYTSDAADE